MLIIKKIMDQDTAMVVFYKKGSEGKCFGGKQMDPEFDTENVGEGKSLQKGVCTQVTSVKQDGKHYFIKMKHCYPMGALEFDLFITEDCSGDPAGTSSWAGEGCIDIRRENFWCGPDAQRDVVSNTVEIPGSCGMSLTQAQQDAVVNSDVFAEGIANGYCSGASQPGVTNSCEVSDVQVTKASSRNRRALSSESVTVSYKISITVQAQTKDAVTDATDSIKDGVSDSDQTDLENAIETELEASIQRAKAAGGSTDPLISGDGEIEVADLAAAVSTPTPVAVDNVVVGTQETKKVAPMGPVYEAKKKKEAAADEAKKQKEAAAATTTTEAAGGGDDNTSNDDTATTAAGTSSSPSGAAMATPMAMLVMVGAIAGVAL